MPVQCDGYKISNTKWKHACEAQVQKSTKSKESHAERAVFSELKLKGSGPHLIVQDAFPCYDSCHQYFLGATAKHSVIIKVTADNSFDGGSYTQANHIANLNQYPHYLYYYQGNFTVSSLLPNAPNGFPTHPSPQNE